MSTFEQHRIQPNEGFLVTPLAFMVSSSVVTGHHRDRAPSSIVDVSMPANVFKILQLSLEKMLCLVTVHMVNFRTSQMR